MVETVNFDVGGKKYRVSKSQIDLHPNTMIAKLVSDQWHQDAENEIFIDRDGTLFQFVLNYLRDGKVYLPITVSKAALMEELRYFGFEDVDESSVDDNDSYHVMEKVFKEAYIESIDGDCSYVAAYLIEQYLKTGCHSTEFRGTICNDENGRKLFNRVERIPNTQESLEKINEVLNKAGLTMQKFFDPNYSFDKCYFKLNTVEPK